MIYWFFGFPGSGKDYCAKILGDLLNATYLNTDDFLTEREKQKLLNGTFTVTDRLAKLKRIVAHITNKLSASSDVVTGDSLPDHQSREFLYNTFGNSILFILVKVSPDVHKKRITKRKNHFFTEKLLQDWVNKHWVDPIKVPHVVLDNNQEGFEYLKRVIRKITCVTL